MADFGFEDLDDLLDGLNDQLADLDSEFADLQPDEPIRPRLESFKVEFKPAAPEDFDDIDGLLNNLPAKSKAAAVTMAQQRPAEKPQVEEENKDDIMAALNKAADDIMELDPAVLAKSKEQKIQEAMQRLKEANIKKLNLRIYIEDAKNFKTVSITSLMENEDIIAEVLEKAHLDEDPTWNLFECVFDLGIERPIRLYEKLTDVVWTWEVETTNIIMLRKYPQKAQLNSVQIMEEFPRVDGVMYFENKKVKWTKRYFEFKLSGMYHYKDTKLTQETYLCNWHEYEIYETSAMRKKAPSKSSFALRYQEKLAKAVDQTNYVVYFCVENDDIMNKWIAAFRNAKNRKYLEDHPEMAAGKSLKMSAEASILRSFKNALSEKPKKATDSEPEPAAAAAAPAPTPAPILTRGTSTSSLKSSSVPEPESPAPTSLPSALKRSPSYGTPAELTSHVLPSPVLPPTPPQKPASFANMNFDTPPSPQEEPEPQVPSWSQVTPTPKVPIGGVSYMQPVPLKPKTPPPPASEPISQPPNLPPKPKTPPPMETAPPVAMRPKSPAPSQDLPVPFRPKSPAPTAHLPAPPTAAPATVARPKTPTQLPAPVPKSTTPVVSPFAAALNAPVPQKPTGAAPVVPAATTKPVSAFAPAATPAATTKPVSAFAPAATPLPSTKPVSAFATSAPPATTKPVSAFAPASAAATPAASSSAAAPKPVVPAAANKPKPAFGAQAAQPSVPPAANKPKPAPAASNTGGADDELQARMRKIAARNMTE